MSEPQIERLTDVQRARSLFETMERVFDSGYDAEGVSDAYLARILARDDFWALAALVDGQIVGGLTAHTLPLTRAEESEVFIYDIAVMPEFQRQGIGRRLVTTLRSEVAAAGIGVMFVPADNEDTHALDFYRAIGGVATPVTIFTFSDTPDRRP